MRTEELTNAASKVFKPPSSRWLRFALALLVAAVCLWAMVGAWRAGASRLLTYHARAARLLAQADEAVETAPHDPEARSARALVLLNNRDLAAALAEYERAAALRPRDYLLWLELGRARDRANDAAGALAAMEQSARLAPAYAQPRWHLGNVLFRAGRFEEGFVEMRRAAFGDASLLPGLIDLAWNVSGDDPAVVEQLIQPERASWHTALAKYFAGRGRAAEALAQFRAAGGIREEDRQALVKELLAARRYAEAYEVWAAKGGAGDRGAGAESSRVHDGGFADRMARDNSGFGWRPAQDADALRISLDKTAPRSGAQSLRVDFNGSPGSPMLTQLIVVAPETRYRLSFGARTEDVVTGGPPFVGVSDAGGEQQVTLARSESFEKNSGGWREYTVEFTTGKTTSAVVLSLAREDCGGGPCPIFGRLWLDDFEIREAK
ncbi:MAG TPA: carbohydrate binding domain-containing protein [Pyrinomonadaceae bacterium]|nr:carbohydrate binding domain-containing protein [Pyrinomonadaceae bacterium]